MNNLTIILIPKNEAYCFTRKLFFYLFNTDIAPFISTLEDIKVYGYMIHNKENKCILSVEESLYNEFVTEVLPFVNSKYPTETNLIITETIDDRLEGNIIDISSLNDYYQTDLNFEKFVKDLFNSKTEIIQ